MSKATDALLRCQITVSFSDTKPCPDIKGRCFRLPPYLYMLINKDIGWYQAREQCRQYNMDLAYFDDIHLRTVSSHIQDMQPGVQSVWIGLRKAEFVLQTGRDVSITADWSFLFQTMCMTL